MRAVESAHSNAPLAMALIEKSVLIACTPEQMFELVDRVED